MSNGKVRKLGIGTALLALIHVLGHMSSGSAAAGGVRRHLSEHHTNTVTTELPHEDSVWWPIIKYTQQAEHEITEFFHGDERALENGVPIGGTEDSTPFLTKRLARRIAQCRQGISQEDCDLKVAFVGSAQMTGHDMFYRDSFPFLTEQRLRPIADAAGLELKIMNNALDHDHSKEGPQSTHMCISNYVGDSVDIIAWDLDAAMQGAPPAQFEAFVRWAFASNPAMIMINRGGPHARSRRGVRKTIVNLGGGAGHDANIWEEKPEDMPEQRDEPYIGSDTWKERWEDGRNEFWNDIVNEYSDFVDFAAVDPAGSIWTLDHLEAFSNAALEADKALPLFDCGNEHPGPCDQIPPFVTSRLEERNISLADFPRDQLEGGSVCGALYGCRNILYGGKKSHVLRGELNALPILRSFQFAASKLASPDGSKDLAITDEEMAVANSRSLSLKSLPAPKYCHETYCSAVPTCMTTYQPNLGLSLSSSLLSNNNTFPPATIPRMGASHFADNPEFAVENLEKRDAPLGYVDRKFAYRLTEPVPTPIYVNGSKTDEFEPEDSATADISFFMNGEGPVVLCEPPCFMDRCPQMRRMPLVTHVTMELDGNALELPQDLPTALEAGGPFCKTIAEKVQPGEHILRLTANTKAPHFSMFSHLIAFSS